MNWIFYTLPIEVELLIILIYNKQVSNKCKGIENYVEKGRTEFNLVDFLHLYDQKK